MDTITNIYLINKKRRVVLAIITYIDEILNIVNLLNVICCITINTR